MQKYMLCKNKLENYAKDHNYQIDLSNHSRGGLTASVALQYANRSGLTMIPIRESRFYGTATNVQDYADQLANKNGYAGSKVYSAVHYTDFVGRSPLVAGRSKYIVGGNNPTGGVEDKWFLYSHSSYFWEVPKEYLTDESGNFIDINGHRVDKPVENPYLKEFNKKWIGDVNQNLINPSLPIFIKPNQ